LHVDKFLSEENVKCRMSAVCAKIGNKSMTGQVYVFLFHFRLLEIRVI